MTWKMALESSQGNDPVTATDVSGQADLAAPDLDARSLRRLVLSLIMAEQDQLQRSGSLHRDHHLLGMVATLPDAEIDRLAIAEDQLGFDSLARLDLILSINRFFQLDMSGVEDYLLVHPTIGDWIRLIGKHRSIVADDWSFGFATSGSAGKPKIIVHEAKTLWAEMMAQRAGPFQDILPSGRIICLVPPHHIYGFLFSCVLAEILGAEVIDLHRAAPTAAFREAKRGDLVVGTPFNWEMLCKTDKSFSDGIYGVMSAGPSTPQSWKAATDLGLTRMTEIFGATETGGLGTRTSGDTPFTLLPHLIMQKGEVICQRRQRPLTLQDDLAWVNDREFTVQGRKDHAVQVAGVNVSPAMVTDHIKQVDGVADAVVRPGDPRLKAFVVPTDFAPDEETLRRAIQSHLQHHLAPVARPSSIDFGPALPRNGMGKLVDWHPRTADIQGAARALAEAEQTSPRTQGN